MKCEVAMERLLEADPSELEGRGESELARHVAGCERCGRVAARLAAELAEVDDALAAYGAAGDPDAAAGRVLGEAGIESRGSRVESRGSRIESRGSRSWRAAWRRRIGVPLAVAAALATLLLLGRGEETPPPVPADGASERSARVAVVAPPDRGVAVLETRNPKITIIWLYEREES